MLAKHLSMRGKLTAGSRWKMTTLPPLSPVAKRSPSWLNSTQDMMSAVRAKQQSLVTFKVSPRVDVSDWVLPSVTSSSRVPLTCEKHHWISLEPAIVSSKMEKPGN